jgi:hypothetical protein
MRQLLWCRAGPALVDSVWSVKQQQECWKRRRMPALSSHSGRRLLVFLVAGMRGPKHHANTSKNQKLCLFGNPLQQTKSSFGKPQVRLGHLRCTQNPNDREHVGFWQSLRVRQPASIISGTIMASLNIPVAWNHPFPLIPTLSFVMDAATHTTTLTSTASPMICKSSCHRR